MKTWDWVGKLGKLLLQNSKCISLQVIWNFSRLSKLYNPWISILLDNLIWTRNSKFFSWVYLNFSNSMLAIRLTLWIFSFGELFLWKKGDDSEAFDGDPNVSKLPNKCHFLFGDGDEISQFGKIIFLCLRSISWNWYIYTTVQYFCLLYISKSSISICSWCPLTSILIYVQCLSKLGHLSRKSKTKCKNKRK